MPGAAFSGIRFTLDLTPDSSFASRRASSGESLTPASSTYSNVMRLRRFNGNRLQASMMSATPYFLLIGTRSPRIASVGACSEMARFGMSGSLRQAFERRQQADRRQRDPARRHGEAVLVRQNAQRLHRLVVVVQRFAHPHQDELNRLSRMLERVGEHADLADDFAGGQVPHQPHLAGEAEAARHRASDLGRDAEGHRRRVGDEHRFDHVAVGEAQQRISRCRQRIARA